MLDRLDEQALVRLARHGRRPAVAPLEHRLPTREAQPALRLLAAVALLALLDQERPDLLLEERDPVGIIAGARPVPGRRGRAAHGQQGEAQPHDDDRPSSHRQFPHLGHLVPHVFRRVSPPYMIASATVACGSTQRRGTSRRSDFDLAG